SNVSNVPSVPPPSARPASARPASSRARENPQVAETILEQLGGQRFIAMTGAKNFLGDSNALGFKLPAGIARDGINHVRITLDPSDTYTVVFTKLGRAPGYAVTVIAEVENVHDDSLRAVFTRYTGLDTSMGSGAPR